MFFPSKNFSLFWKVFTSEVKGIWRDMFLNIMKVCLCWSLSDFFPKRLFSISFNYRASRSILEIRLSLCLYLLLTYYRSFWQKDLWGKLSRQHFRGVSTDARKTHRHTRRVRHHLILPIGTYVTTVKLFIHRITKWGSFSRLQSGTK